MATLFALLLVLPAAAEPTGPTYAPAKIASPSRASRANVHLALPASAWPRRGMLVATGNILSPLASWIIVDLERQTIRQLTTRLADGNEPVRIDTDWTDTLPDDERRAVIAAANGVWSERDPDPPVPGEVTDALCSVALFDGDDVLHEFGSECPRARFVEAMEAVAASADERTVLPGLRVEDVPIGSAHREPDGTLVLRLRAESGDGSLVGDGELRYRPGDPDYGHVLRHLGPIPPGGEVLVRPFPPAWPDEPAGPPQRPRS